MNVRDQRIEWNKKFRANKCKAIYRVKGGLHFTYNKIDCEQTQDQLPVTLQEDDLGGVVEFHKASTRCSLAVKTTLQRVENKTENTAMPLSTSWLYAVLVLSSLTGYSRIGKDSGKWNKDHIHGNLASIQGSTEQAGMLQPGQKYVREGKGL